MADGKKIFSRIKFIIAVVAFVIILIKLFSVDTDDTEELSSVDTDDIEELFSVDADDT